MIEHDPLEVAEQPSEAPPEPQQPTPGPHVHQDRPSPQDVVIAALLERLDCTVCEKPEGQCEHPSGWRIDVRANLAVRALVMYGYVEDTSEPTFDAAEAAQWLAPRTGFPRYAADGGWEKILQSDRDVEVAAHKAMQRVGADEQGTVKAVRAGLLQWHQERTT